MVLPWWHSRVCLAEMASADVLLGWAWRRSLARLRLRRAFRCQAAECERGVVAASIRNPAILRSRSAGRGAATRGGCRSA
eukprot:6440340-Alexandrium_andersonii.AAC.1